METVRISLIGIGSVRCGSHIVASLANYFGERPLDITLWDADPERLELFHRLAKICFLMTRSPHQLSSTDDVREALSNADKIVLSIGRNCAYRVLRPENRESGGEAIPSAIRALSIDQYTQSTILSLQKLPIPIPAYYTLPWPPELSEEARAGFPFQLLRWVNGEEYPVDVLRECEKSPLSTWVDNPTSANYVQAP